MKHFKHFEEQDNEEHVQIYSLSHYSVTFQVQFAISNYFYFTAFNTLNSFWRA